MVTNPIAPLTSRWPIADAVLHYEYTFGVFAEPRSQWMLTWRRRYDKDTSDQRIVFGATMDEVVAGAVAWEEQNDVEEPEHAPVAAEGSGG